MLKRSKILVAFLVVTVVCASVGFAVVTDTLTADGTVKLDATAIQKQLDTEVYFTGVSATATLSNTSATGTATAAINGTEDKLNDNVTITIGEGSLLKINDTATVTVNIHNASTAQKVKVNTITATVEDDSKAESKCFSITATTADNATEIAAGGDLVLTIVVKLVQLPTDAITENINVSFTVESIIAND